MKFLFFFTYSLWIHSGFTFDVALYDYRTNNTFCKASYLTSTWIITAKHCVRNIRLKEEFMSVWDNEVSLNYTVKKIIHHSSLDLALVKINSHYKLTSLPWLSKSPTDFKDHVFFVNNNQVKFEISETKVQTHYLRAGMDRLIKKGWSGSPLYYQNHSKYVLTGILISTPSIDRQEHITFVRINKSVIQWIQEIIK